VGTEAGSDDLFAGEGPGSYEPLAARLAAAAARAQFLQLSAGLSGVEDIRRAAATALAASLRRRYPGE